MNKKFLLIIIIGLGLIGTALFFKYSLKNENEKKENLNFNMNLDSGLDTKKSQLEAYEAEESEENKKNRNNKSVNVFESFGKVNSDSINSQNNSTQNDSININSNKMNLDLLNNKSKTDSEIIDSILASHKIVYNTDNNKSKKNNSVGNSVGGRNGNNSAYGNSRNKRLADLERKRKERERKLEAEKLERERKLEAERLRKENELFKKRERERLSAAFSKKGTKNKSNNTDKNIPIIVNGDQNIKNGSRVNLLLSKDVTINNIKYKRNTKLYGFASFGEHRLFININNINNTPVKLKIYDAQDGSLGLYTKENMLGEINTEVKDDLIDDIKIGGIKVGSTVKKIFKKKNKEPKLLLFNRTQFLLN